MSIKDFFTDKHDNQTIFQPPNIPLGLWAVFTVINLLFFMGKQSGLSLLTTAALFTWAYLEVMNGNSPFRRVLGSLIILYIVVKAFVG